LPPLLRQKAFANLRGGSQDKIPYFLFAAEFSAQDAMKGNGKGIKRIAAGQMSIY
jgi:hypothetical protein